MKYKFSSLLFHDTLPNNPENQSRWLNEKYEKNLPVSDMLHFKIPKYFTDGCSPLVKSHWLNLPPLPHPPFMLPAISRLLCMVIFARFICAVF